MLATAIQRVRAARRAGKTDQEIGNAGLLVDLDGTYGKGFFKPEGSVQMLLAGVPR